MTNELKVASSQMSALLPKNEQASPVVVRNLGRNAPYAETLERMEQIALDVAAGRGAETILMLEHPPLFTKGTSAQDTDLLDLMGFDVYETGRGGEFTYHGPGQRIVYLVLDLDRRKRDVRLYVRTLESWIIAALGRLGVKGERREGRVGIWVQRPDKGAGVEDKIAAIGIRVRKWVTFHGISINVDPDLSHYRGIVPCGISDHGVTSLADLGVGADMSALDDALLATFSDHFGPFAE